MTKPPIHVGVTILSNLHKYLYKVLFETYCANNTKIIHKPLCRSIKATCSLFGNETSQYPALSCNCSDQVRYLGKIWYPWQKKELNKLYVSEICFNYGSFNISRKRLCGVAAIIASLSFRRLLGGTAELYGRGFVSIPNIWCRIVDIDPRIFLLSGFVSRTMEVSQRKRAIEPFQFSVVSSCNLLSGILRIINIIVVITSNHSFIVG